MLTANTVGASVFQFPLRVSRSTSGEYSFCFENDMSTLTEKLIDFDIMVESEPRKEVCRHLRLPSPFQPHVFVGPRKAWSNQRAQQPT